MTKSYRAIMIDPQARSVSELEISGKLDEMHKLVGAGTLAADTDTPSRQSPATLSLQQRRHCSRSPSGR